MSFAHFFFVKGDAMCDEVPVSVSELHSQKGSDAIVASLRFIGGDPPPLQQRTQKPLEDPENESDADGQEVTAHAIISLIKGHH